MHRIVNHNYSQISCNHSFHDDFLTDIWYTIVEIPKHKGVK